MKNTALLLFELAGKAFRILKNEGILRLLTRSASYLCRRRIRKGTEGFRPSPEALEKMRAECGAFSDRPTISVILPVCHNDPRGLRSSIDSVLNQVYENWELCIAEGPAAAPHTAELLESYRQKDQRIKLRRLSGDPGVSALSNEAFAMATGEFTGLLDPGDELLPSALYEVVRHVNRVPETDFIYSDEVLLDPSDAPIYTYYRPDFSLDYLLSHCYIVHFSVVRTALIGKTGGFRSACAAAALYDLFLRLCSETGKVCHIRKVLYFRREQDPAAAPASEVTDASRKALRDYLDREHVGAEVLDTGYGDVFRVKRTILGNPQISIVIPIKDKVDLLKRCIGSIEAKTTYNHYEVIIVDNFSREADTFAYLASLEKRSGAYRVVTFKEDFNYSRVNNFAVHYALGEHLLFLNNDVEIIAPEWLEAMLEHSQRKEVGCVGAKLLYPDGKLQHVGVVIGLYGAADHIYKGHESQDIGYMGHPVSIRNCSAVTAACMMVKSRVFAEAGGFDERYKVGFGDTDFCLKVREKGYVNLYTPYAELYHHESATRGQSLDSDPHLEDTQRFIKRWQELIHAGDPFYNPNLPLYSQPAQGQKVFQALK